MLEQLNMKKQETFVYLDNLFKNGISKEWLYILAYGNVFIYEGGIVSTLFIDGVCYINSGSKDNINFTFEMQKKVISIIKEYDKVVMQASYPDRVGHIFKKLGFRYNSANNSYEKGV